MAPPLRSVTEVILDLIDETTAARLVDQETLELSRRAMQMKKVKAAQRRNQALRHPGASGDVSVTEFAEWSDDDDSNDGGGGAARGNRDIGGRGGGGGARLRKSQQTNHTTAYEWISQAKKTRAEAIEALADLDAFDRKAQKVAEAVQVGLVKSDNSWSPEAVSLADEGEGAIEERCCNGLVTVEHVCEHFQTLVLPAKGICSLDDSVFQRFSNLVSLDVSRNSLRSLRGVPPTCRLRSLYAGCNLLGKRSEDGDSYRHDALETANSLNGGGGGGSNCHAEWSLRTDVKGPSGNEERLYCPFDEFSAATAASLEVLDLSYNLIETIATGLQASSAMLQQMALAKRKEKQTSPSSSPLSSPVRALRSPVSSANDGVTTSPAGREKRIIRAPGARLAELPSSSRSSPWRTAPAPSSSLPLLQKFSSLQFLDLSWNCLCDLQQICMALSYLYNTTATENHHSPLRHVILLGNPLALLPHYRSRVLRALGGVMHLDDVFVSRDEWREVAAMDWLPSDQEDNRFKNAYGQCHWGLSLKGVRGISALRSRITQQQQLVGDLSGSGAGAGDATNKAAGSKDKGGTATLQAAFAVSGVVVGPNGDEESAIEEYIYVGGSLEGVTKGKLRSSEVIVSADACSLTDGDGGGGGGGDKSLIEANDEGQDEKEGENFEEEQKEIKSEQEEGGDEGADGTAGSNNSVFWRVYRASRGRMTEMHATVKPTAKLRDGVWYEGFEGTLYHVITTTTAAKRRSETRRTSSNNNKQEGDESSKEGEEGEEKVQESADVTQEGEVIEVGSFQLNLKRCLEGDTAGQKSHDGSKVASKVKGVTVRRWCTVKLTKEYEELVRAQEEQGMQMAVSLEAQARAEENGKGSTKTAAANKAAPAATAIVATASLDAVVTAEKRPWRPPRIDVDVMVTLNRCSHLEEALKKILQDEAEEDTAQKEEEEGNTEDLQEAEDVSTDITTTMLKNGQTLPDITTTINMSVTESSISVVSS